MFGVGSKNKCSLEELHDLTAKYNDLQEAMVQLFNSNTQMSSQELMSAAKRLAQELQVTAQQIKQCRANLEDPEVAAKEFLKKYSLV